jgi:hypothetical protein
MNCLKGFLTFVIVGFWPAGLFVAFPVSSIFLHLRIPGISFGYVIAAIIIMLFLLLSFMVAYWLFASQTTWKNRTWVIYATWLFMALIGSFVISAALGGASMAVVEGVAGSVITRYVQYAVSALVLTLLGNLLLVPWTFFVIFLLKVVNQRFRLWSDASI